MEEAKGGRWLDMAVAVRQIAITPFSPRGLVRIVADGGTLEGRAVAEVEYVGDHPHGYADGQAGAYFVDELMSIALGADLFCAVCGWSGSDRVCCPRCLYEPLSSVPSQAAE